MTKESFEDLAFTEHIEEMLGRGKHRVTYETRFCGWFNRRDVKEIFKSQI